MTRANAINRLLLRYWFYNVREEDIAELLDTNIIKYGDIQAAYLNSDCTLSLNCGNKRTFNPHEVSVLLGITQEDAENRYKSGLRASDIVQIQGLTAEDTAG